MTFVRRSKAALGAVWHARWSRVLGTLVASTVMVTAVALAFNTPNAEFEIDGDLVTSLSPGGGAPPTLAGLDWAWFSANDDDGALTWDGLNPPADNPDTIGTAGFFADDLKVDPDGSTFSQGNKENDFSTVSDLGDGTLTLLSDTPWSIVSGSVPPNKDDLFNVYNYVYIAAADEADVVLAFERTNNLGSSHVDFELNRLPWVPCASDSLTLCPQRVEGDILISYEISPNAVPVATIFRWDLPGGIDGGGQGLGGGPNGEECQGFLAAGGNRTKPCPWEEVVIDPASIVATLNKGGAIDSGPWGSREPDGTPTPTIPQFGFFETFLDFDALGFGPGCPGFATASAKSRSSDSVTSALQDLAGPFDIDLNTCGEIVIVKETDPVGGTGFDFDHDYTGAQDAVADFTLDDGQSNSSGQIAPGTYLVTEVDLPSGWDLVDIECDDFDSTVDVDTATATIVVDPFETVTCTYANVARATLIVEKQTDPDGAAGSFGFTGAASGTISDNGTITVMDLAPGTYTVTENDPTPSFDLTSIVCDDGNSTGDVGWRTATYNLEAGETVTCTFTNTQRGTIIVEKQTDPDGAAGSFGFTGAASGTISDDGTITVTDLVPGTYEVTEDDPTSAGFRLDSIVCDDGNSSGNVGSRTATYNLDPGETVTCTFTNSTGAIQITKTAKNLALGSGQQPLAGVEFEASATAAPGDSATTDASGVACIQGLTPGVEYTVTETVPTGYSARTESQTVTVTAGATCSIGTPDSLMFVNDPLSEIEITFRSLAGPGVTAATSVQCTGPSADGSEKGPLGNGQSTTLTALVEGTYVCTILIDP